MAKPNILPALVAALALSLGLAGGACSSSVVTTNGACAVDDTVDCGVIVDGGEQPAGLTGYSCAGSARPDSNARYVQGVPEGTVCAQKGMPADGKTSFCCSSAVTDCAYNPVATCTDPGTVGYECQGATRPESFNALNTCGNGVDNGDYIDYCCTSQNNTAPCTELKGGTCSSQLTPFSCSGATLPRAEQFGVSESRADYYRPLCSTPMPAPNPNQKSYCCYMPALIPEGGSCVQDTTVASCTPGQFGFACYGPETPDKDYLPMKCPTPGVAGKSAEGYPATLYCCDFDTSSDTTSN
ncbi:MAG TPA: hypothetical protein VK745_28755 [Polyangiaceae bacterium]|jgi:hypothetical protein|nr:hypothetical protein [Polyangiaceae bacterium]